MWDGKGPGTLVEEGFKGRFNIIISQTERDMGHDIFARYSWNDCKVSNGNSVQQRDEPDTLAKGREQLHEVTAVPREWGRGAGRRAQIEWSGTNLVDR